MTTIIFLLMTSIQEHQNLINGEYHYNKKNIYYKRLKYTYIFLNFIMIISILYFTASTYTSFETKYGKLEKKLDKITKPIHELTPLINDLADLNITNINITKVADEIEHDLNVINDVIKVICQYINCTVTVY